MPKQKQKLWFVCVGSSVNMKHENTKMLIPYYRRQRRLQSSAFYYCTENVHKLFTHNNRALRAHHNSNIFLFSHFGQRKISKSISFGKWVWPQCLHISNSIIDFIEGSVQITTTIKHIGAFFTQTTRWLIGNVLHLRRTDNNSTYLKCTHELFTQIQHIWCWFYCCRNAILPSEISYIQTSIEMLRMCLQCTGVDILAIYSSIRISKISYSNFKLPSLASEERKKIKSHILHRDHCWRSPTFRVIRQYFIILCAHKK